MLAALGGLAGVGLGMTIAAAAPTLIPAGLLPPAVTVVFDFRVAAFAAAATLAVGLLFGVAPAWQATDLDPTAVLATESRSVAGGGGRLRSLLVGAEVATAVVLLAGAGLLLRTLVAVETFDRGYRATEVLTMYVDPLSDRYPTRESLIQFYDEVRREVAAVPGVAQVAWTSQLPLTAEDARDVSFEVAGAPAVDERHRPAADNHIVSHGYFEALDLPIVAGRGFTDRDTAGSPPVCLVNEALVRGHFQGRTPLGVRLALRPASRPRAEPSVCEIIGVVRQVRGRPDERETFVQVYRPLGQGGTSDIYLVVRPVSGEAAPLSTAVRAAVSRVDRDQLVGVRDIQTLADVAWTATERHRFRAWLVVVFAGLALTLAMVGVFGIVGFAVQQRVREFAVRRALGATTGEVVRLVVAGIAPVFAGGLAIGLGLAATLGRMFGAVLVDVDPLDPLTFATTSGVLVLVGLAGHRQPGPSRPPRRSGTRAPRKLKAVGRRRWLVYNCGTMTVSTNLPTAMTAAEMVALSKRHTIFEWSAQGAVDPIAVARAKGVYFWTPDGKRYLDFNSQLMCVNIGHGDERVIRAIQDQAATLAYANPFMATEPRARLGAKLADDHARRHRHASSSPTAAPKRTRTRSRWRAG